MEIKFMVSQTFGGFSSIRAGNLFFIIGSVVFVIIINCISTWIQYLQKSAKLHKSKHRTIKTSALESKSTKKNCNTAFYILAVSIKCSFDRWFHTKKKVAKMKKEHGRVWETVNLITMALARFTEDLLGTVHLWCRIVVNLYRWNTSEKVFTLWLLI